MIEEIKKEIENSGTYSIGDIEFQNKRITIKKAFEILDKYKDKENKYKTMWEELKALYEEPFKNCKTENDYIICGMSGISAVLTSIQELESKHGIEVK